MNVLLTSVGRRSYLVNYFKEALGQSGEVIAANSEQLTSGMIAADRSYVVPRVNESDYIPALRDICKKENIQLIVSLFDIDLPFLAAAREELEQIGVKVAIADSWAIDIANDKWKTFLFLSENNVQTPTTYIDLEFAKAQLRNGKIRFPLIVKPRWGMGSLSIFKAENIEELEFFYNFSQKEIAKSYLKILSSEEIDKSVIVQEFLSHKEFNLDVFNDLEGEYIQTIAKQKLAMRSGETDMAKIVEKTGLEDIGKKLSSLLKHRGNMDVDVLQDLNGKLYVLEMNMRFGGGYPFSHIAGANFPKALIDLVNGKKVKPFIIEPGCTALKSIQLIKA